MIAEIDFGGRKLELVYGLPAIRAIYEQLDKVSFLKAETYDIVSLVNIAYEGYVNGCLVNRIVPDITFKEFFSWVEDNANSAEMLKVVDAFNDSKYIKKAVEVKEEEKKRSTGRKLKGRHTAN